MPPRFDILSRAHLGAADLDDLRAFASRSIGERFPLEATWHPGNIVWDLLYSSGAPQALRLWSGPGGLVAVAWFQDPGELWIECLARHEALVPEMIGWAEAACTEQPAPGGALSVITFLTDSRRIEALEALGYRPGEQRSVHFRCALSGDIPPTDLPPGFRIRDCVGINSEVRAACHRHAWNHLDHIGLPDARSQFSAEVYEQLKGAAGYDPTLDLIVEAEDGTPAANCVCWWDPESGVGTFEPVGTHVEFRGQGLARAVVTEGLHRLKARDAGWGRVGTASFNHPAVGAYLSCGFELIDRTARWTRSIA